MNKLLSKRNQNYKKSGFNIITMQTSSIQTWSDKDFNGAVVNRALPSLHGGRFILRFKQDSKTQNSSNNEINSCCLHMFFFKTEFRWVGETKVPGGGNYVKAWGKITKTEQENVKEGGGDIYKRKGIFPFLDKGVKYKLSQNI